MNMLQDAINTASDVFVLYLQNGTLMIAKCHHIDDEKFLVIHPHFISIMIDEVGNKASFLMPMANETIIENPVSHFYYCDVLTMYKPKDEFKDHFLKVINHEPVVTEKATTKKEEVVVPNEEEKVIQVDFKAKKRKPSANTTPVVTITEPEPDGAA